MNRPLPISDSNLPRTSVQALLRAAGLFPEPVRKTGGRGVLGSETYVVLDAAFLTPRRILALARVEWYTRVNGHPRKAGEYRLYLASQARNGRWTAPEQLAVCRKSAGYLIACALRAGDSPLAWLLDRQPELRESVNQYFIKRN